jgi:phosphoglycerol transferase MdoB-like AlkP superfamily enzyme
MLPSVISSLGAVVLYALYFWRIFKQNPGNRVVQCGVLAIAALLAMAFLSRLGEIPDWIFAIWILLLILLCFSALFFVAQRGYRAIRRHRDQ